jgi:hypothetical protein
VWIPRAAMPKSTRDSNHFAGQFLAKHAAIVVPQGMRRHVHIDVRSLVHKLCG